MEDDGRPLRDPVEDVERAAARVEEVLRQRLVEVHLGLLREDVPEVDGAKPDPHAEVGQPEAVSHGRPVQLAGAAAFGFSFIGTLQPPLPLQAFWPAHLCSAVLQAPWPLHSL